MKSQVNLGGWTFMWSENGLRVSYEEIDTLRRVLTIWAEAWRQHGPKETTLAWEVFSIPSILVRVDYTSTPDGPFVYEVEERPSGLGIVCHFIPEFRQSLENWFRSTLDGKPIVLISPHRRGEDDSLWTETASILNLNPCQNRVNLVRAEPEEVNEGFYPRLAKNSVSTIKTEGWKGYGVHLRWWKEVSYGGELPWDVGFVLKPLQGSKMRDVEIWDPQRREGSSTRSRIEKTLQRCGSMYLQQFVEPEPYLEGRQGWRIRRLFFVYNIREGWIPIGGLWNARPCLRIHGASDAVFGPLILP